MTGRLIIAGIERVLDWTPSKRTVGGLKPDVDIASLPATPPWLAAFPRTYDQLQLNSCGPNAVAENFEFRLGGSWSRLFAYYWTRAVEGDTADDGGVTIPDLLDVAHTFGLPPEALWPYDLAQFATCPPREVLEKAAAHRVLVHDQVVDLDHLLHELAHGQPVLLGFGVPASMEDGAGDTATTGVVRVPSDTDPRVGGHAVNAVTYSIPRRAVQCTSHYGAGYGDHGTLWLPFEHWTTGNAKDMRAIRKIGAA